MVKTNRKCPNISRWIHSAATPLYLYGSRMYAKWQDCSGKNFVGKCQKNYKKLSQDCHQKIKKNTRNLYKKYLNAMVLEADHINNL